MKEVGGGIGVRLVIYNEIFLSGHMLVILLAMPEFFHARLKVFYLLNSYCDICDNLHFPHGFLF